MKIAITGANGLLGRAVTNHLKECGHELITLSRANINYNDKVALVEVFLNVDAVIHTAGVILSRTEQQQRPADALTENIVLDIAITDAARKAGVKKVILCSSILAYGTATGPLTEDMIGNTTIDSTTKYYGHAKLTTCLLAKTLQAQHKQNVISLIFPNLYGPNDKFDYQPPPLVPNALLQITNAHQQALPTLTAGDNGHIEIELLHTADAAHAIGALLTEPNLPAILNVPATNTNTIGDVYVAAANAVGYTGDIVWDEPTTQKPVPKKLVGEKIHSLIDWEPTITLTDGVQEVWDTYKQHNKGV